MKAKSTRRDSTKSVRSGAAEKVERSKKAVLAATFKLMSEAGLSGVVIDEVSRRSGVAKTTIYRHWASRSELLLSACALMSARPEPPNTGTLKGDLKILIAKMALNLRTARWAAILPSIIDAAERDPELARLHADLNAQFMSALYLVVDRAQKRGELPRSRPSSQIIASIAGPLFYRRWFSREPLDELFVKSIIDRVVDSANI